MNEADSTVNCRTSKKRIELIFDWREGIFNVDIILTEPSLNASLIEF